MQERLIGVGRIVEGRKTIAKQVHYELKFEQEVMLKSKRAKPKDAGLVLRRFEGVVDAEAGGKQALAARRKYTLVLEDGMKLDIGITRHDAKYDIYYIKPVSKEFYR
jgi:hypothetical protein